MLLGACHGAHCKLLCCVPKGMQLLSECRPCIGCVSLVLEMLWVPSHAIESIQLKSGESLSFAVLGGIVHWAIADVNLTTPNPFAFNGPPKCWYVGYVSDEGLNVPYGR